MNTLVYRLKLEDQMSPNLKKVSATTGKTGEQFNKLNKEIDKINKNRFEGFSKNIKAVVALTAVTATLKKITSASVEAFNKESIAAQKLEAVMRNTMGSAKDGLKSVMELTTAQERIGVIARDVQLAGAQEMATYLTQKGSLEKLLPVMNDMLAQQYGLNASQEQAAQIASMLGKVMDGQVGALSKYGYKFDEIQENILKTGTEAQRAAVLFDVVSSSVGGVNSALAKSAAGGFKRLQNVSGSIKTKLGEAVVDARVKLIPTLINLSRVGGNVADAMLRWFKIPTSQKMKDEQVQANLLVKKLTDLNTSEKERVSILNELRAIAPDIVNGISSENVEMSKLIDNLREYNTQQSKRIFLQKKQEEIDRYAAQADKNMLRAQEEFYSIQERMLTVIKTAKKINPDLANIVEDAFFGKYWDSNTRSELQDSNDKAWLLLNQAGFDTSESDLDRALAEMNIVAELARRTGQQDLRRNLPGKEFHKYLKHWNSAKYNNDMANMLNREFEEFQKKLGISTNTLSPATNGLTPSATSTQGTAEASSTANAIATGGTKTTNITISLNQLVDTINIAKNGFREGAENMRDIVLDELTRVLAMAQGQA